MILPPKRKDRVIRACDEQEKEGARIVRGEKVRGSGCGHQKGDFTSSLYKGESKTTSKDSFSIKREVICKLIREARAAGKAPLFQFGFDNMPQGFPSDWFALPADAFDAVCGVLSAIGNDDFEEAKEWLARLFWNK